MRFSVIYNRFMFTEYTLQSVLNLGAKKVECRKRILSIDLILTFQIPA